MTWRNGLAAVSLCAALAAFGSRPALAGFSQGSPSAAADGMGGSFMGKADDASALFLNPAGLAQLRQAEASLLYSKPFAGLPQVSIDQQYLALAVPLRPRWTLGVGASALNFAGLLKEHEGVLGGAFRVNSAVSLGMNLTYLSHSYNVSGDFLASSDPVFARGNSKGAIGVDMGMLTRLGDRWAAGLSVRHLNKPDVGLSSSDPAPMEVRAGGLWRLEALSLLADLKVADRGTAIIDRTPVTWSLGAEWSAFENGPASLALRLGLNGHQFTSGLGLRLRNLGLDYALVLVQDLITDSFGSHRISLTYRFGGLAAARSQIAMSPQPVESAQPAQTQPWFAAASTAQDSFGQSQKPAWFKSHMGPGWTETPPIAAMESSRAASESWLWVGGKP